MDENANAPEQPRELLRELSTTPDPGRILSEVQLHQLAQIPDHKLTLRYVEQTFGLTKRDLLRAYVTGEIESSPEPTKVLIQFLEYTFPEDLRIAIIREGQEAMARAMRSLSADIHVLTTAINDLLAEMRAAKVSELKPLNLPIAKQGSQP